MNISECNHFRIRDDNEYGFDVEEFLKSIENKFNVDIRKLPQWKEIIRLLHVSTTDCKLRKQESDLRKKVIIDNIYTQITRPSPWQLNDAMTRTGKKWQAIESKRKKAQLVALNPTQGKESYVQEEYEETDEEVENKTALHPNTEILASGSFDTDLPHGKSDTETETGLDVFPKLPIFLTINPHKHVSPLGSKDSGFSNVSESISVEIKSKTICKEWLSFKPTSMVHCFPEQIVIKNNILKQQYLKFSLLNCTGEYLNLRYKNVTDKIRFKWERIFPETPLRLYPGIRVKFKFTFKLLPNENSEEFVSSLCFKVGHNPRLGLPTETLLLPLITQFVEDTSITISVTETVLFTAAFPWHINANYGYPTGDVKITVKDKRHFILHVIKRAVNFVADSDISISDQAIGPNTESMVEREEYSAAGFLSPEFTMEPDRLTPSQIVKVKSVHTIDLIGSILQEIVDLALEAFLFECTYLELHPNSTHKIQAYFTKAEHIGYHQCYYDFCFCEPDTGKTIETKTVIMLAEVLPHPIKFFPELLDMTNSPITHGFCEDQITIHNTHKVYNVTVTFKLTKKMRNLFSIRPMETVIAPESHANFSVILCSKQFKKTNKRPEYFAYFTVKVIFSGHKAVYKNVPPFFYEIVVPCAFDFKESYNEKYFCGSVSSRELLHSSLKLEESND